MKSWYHLSSLKKFQFKILKMKKAIVIGSGFSGCMFAMMLRQKNWEVTLIEKSKIAGGGVRTFYHGGHPYTYGPRHFIGPESSMPAFEFLNKIIPMRHIKKINYSYQAKDDYFAQLDKKDNN